MKHPGFILIELLVSMVIASMIALALFAGFGQTNRAVQTIDSMVDVSYKQTVAVHQLTKDISGAFIPVQGRKKKQSMSAEALAQEGQEADQKGKKEAAVKGGQGKK